jgi:F0F1-type ATP synthase membrane subunit c/vacuolar-type H+-ATPase subunit K
MRWSISETSASRSSAGGWAGRRLVFVGAAVSVALAVLTPSIPAGASGALSLSGFSPKSGAVGTTVTISGTGFVLVRSAAPAYVAALTGTGPGRTC